MPKTFRHILVIRLSAMGDVAMTVPVLRSFSEHYPHVKITVLTRSHFSAIFRDLPNVSVFPLEVKSKHKGLFGLYKLSIELKRLNIDAVADLHNVLRSKILRLFLFRKRFIQIDKGRKEKKALISGRIFEQLKTTHQRYADVFESLGFKMDLTEPNFPGRAKLNNETLAVIGTDSRKWLGVAPFAKHDSKMYPLDLLEVVIDKLSGTHKIILFGGGHIETGILNSLENKFENAVNLSEKLSLNEELDVISNLDLMLSMDSGNAHMAAMLGIKVITIWGVTHPYAGFAPFNQHLDYAIVSNKTQFPKIPTSVYGNKYPIGYREVTRSIHPEIIVDKIESVI
jgi:ADP-heptose:LPS heptosyltransferase